MEKSIIEIGVYPCHVHREINNRDGCQIPILFIEKLITEIRVTHIPILFIEKLITEMGVYPCHVHREINNRDGVRSLSCS